MTQDPGVRSGHCSHWPVAPGPHMFLTCHHHQHYIDARCCWFLFCVFLFGRCLTEMNSNIKCGHCWHWHWPVALGPHMFLMCHHHHNYIDSFCCWLLFCAFLIGRQWVNTNQCSATKTCIMPAHTSFPLKTSWHIHVKNHAKTKDWMQPPRESNWLGSPGEMPELEGLRNTWHEG